jgi:hypothetical protein
VDRLLRFLSSFDGGEDAAWGCGPHEGFGLGVGPNDESIDGVLEAVDGLEHTAFDAAIATWDGWFAKDHT